MPQTALVVGATGLIGNALILSLLADERFGRVIAIARRPIDREHPKLETKVIDFDQPDAWRSQIVGDVLFSALGTTRKKAGSNEAQYKIDYGYQYAVAEAAAHNGVPTYALVSSGGADANALTFYMKTKGELDRDVQKLGFARVRIVRPGMFAGERQEDRPAERIGGAFLRVLGKLPGLGAIRPIEGDVVARALIAVAADETPGVKIYSAGELFALGGAV